MCEKHMHTYLLLLLHSRFPLEIPIVTDTNIDEYVRTLNLLSFVMFIQITILRSVMHADEIQFKILI